MAEIQTYLYGKKFPNRIFVGGLPVNTKASELAHFFGFFGHVTESKIILDDSGVSKGYGFVTFEDKSSVRQVESMGIIYFKNKKINIGPAVKKESPTVQPELVILPQPSQNLSPGMVLPQNNTIPGYYPVGIDYNLGYNQQPQQPLNPYVSGDYCNAYYQVTNDGVYWFTYPNYSTVVNQSSPPFSPLPRNGRSGSASSGSSEEEVKLKRVNKKKEIPPRFMKK